ncbi:MAG: TonB-dependent receptor plug domain-containing protein [Prevotellaceae bacterium]|jgi:TonB-dependent SusC/RagA subfamily outer membrane receptor|nr:TonB-dependent receptor plug domain-containing protein [Prevotellaceae bacterium]
MKTKLKISVTILSFLLLSGHLNAQSLKGKIVDKKSGEPIAGAVVAYDKGSVLTDDQGTFTVNQKESGDRLSVSILGYKSQEVALGDRPQNLVIRLDAEQKALSEVVVTGYGKSSKEKLIGSVSTITAETLAQYPGTNLLEVLQGRVAGLTIARSSGLAGSATSINIRGVNTFTSGASGCACCISGEVTNTEPLVIVDGVPFINQSVSPLDLGAVGSIGPLATLSTSDVERIDILKDADATAIYGSRGANGVILITTKK